jgi:hypothetical protein
VSYATWPHSRACLILLMVLQSDRILTSGSWLRALSGPCLICVETALWYLMDMEETQF